MEEGMKQWNSREFRLHTLPSEQVIGKYPALEKLAGVAHAVTTRGCGDFGPAHRGQEDSKPQIIAAWRPQDPSRLAFVTDVLGVPGVAWVEHVHGTDVLAADQPGRVGSADGIVTRRPGLAITAFSADCVAILMADPVARAVGAVHAGWKGTAGRGASNLVRAMVQTCGCRPGNLIACLGPSIGPCCFGANPEMVAEVRGNYGRLADQFLLPRGKHIAFDLWRANVLDLQSASVEPGNIHLAGLCTHCNDDLFFSWQKSLKPGTFCSAIALTDGGPAGMEGIPLCM